MLENELLENEFHKIIKLSSELADKNQITLDEMHTIQRFAFSGFFGSYEQGKKAHEMLFKEDLENASYLRLQYIANYVKGKKHLESIK